MISNLPFDTTQEELASFAGQAGEVVNAKIIVDRETGRSKGYGFVTFAESLFATYALEKLVSALVRDESPRQHRLFQGEAA